MIFMSSVHNVKNALHSKKIKCVRSAMVHFFLNSTSTIKLLSSMVYESMIIHVVL